MIRPILLISCLYLCLHDHAASGQVPVLYQPQGRTYVYVDSYNPVYRPQQPQRYVPQYGVKGVKGVKTRTGPYGGQRAGGGGGVRRLGPAAYPRRYPSSPSYASAFPRRPAGKPAQRPVDPLDAVDEANIESRFGTNDINPVGIISSPGPVATRTRTRTSTRTRARGFEDSNRSSYPAECYEPKYSGVCLAYVPSYAFNHRTNHCEQFVYGGCGGNGNRFATEGECLKRCAPEAARQDIAWSA